MNRYHALIVFAIPKCVRLSIHDVDRKPNFERRAQMTKRTNPKGST